MHVKDFRPFLALFAMIAALGFTLSGCSGSMSDAARAIVAPISAEPPAIPLPQAKFAFAPVTGAPATVLMNISAALGREAFAQQVTLVPVDDPAVSYIVKGYLSAVGDASGTIVVYVWDVFDRSGRRVHRISGQERAVGAQRDPWSTVDSMTATDIARQTISSIVAWGRSGTTGAAIAAEPLPAAVPEATPGGTVPVSAMPVTTTQPASVITTTPAPTVVPTAPTLPPLPAAAPGSG